MSRDIRTLTDEELVETLSTGGKVEIPEECTLMELIKIHERLDLASSTIRTKDMSAVKAKLKELEAWRDKNIPTQQVIADNKLIKVSVVTVKK